MRCRRVRKLLDLVLQNDPLLELEERAAVQEHLSRCIQCRQEYEIGCQVVALVRQYGELSEDTAALLERAREPRHTGLVLKQAVPSRWRANRVAVAVMAAAACLVLCVFGSWAIQNQEGSGREPGSPTATSDVAATAPAIELANGGGRLAPGTTIQTGAGEMESLTLGRRHKIVMNANTRLSMEPLQRDRTGWLVTLALGEVFVHVEHDGHPFIVESPHGKAVITGTAFDVKVTDLETTLVVAEGSVRFESAKGMAQVTAGHRSTVRAQSQPTEPVACNAESLVAWATGSEGLPPVPEMLPGQDWAKLADELFVPLSYPGRPIDLGTLDHDQWIKSKRGWFKGQFPWIFEFQEAMIDDYRLQSIDIPDYPLLLLQSGDIWQIRYPHHLYGGIPLRDTDSVLRMMKRYGLDGDWHLTKGPDQETTEGRSSDHLGQAALKQWMVACRDLQYDCGHSDQLEELCEYSLAAGRYLENTRVLAWLCVQHGGYPIGTSPELLQSLAEIVRTAFGCQDIAWQLERSREQIPSQCQELLQKLMQSIELISAREELIRLELKRDY
jgi:predicted anti-sigma-YlaC factor YlaD